MRRSWRSNRRAWCSEVASPPRQRGSSGAIERSSRAFTATRSTGCAPRSSRSARPTSCGFSSGGSTSIPSIGWPDSTDCARHSRSSTDSSSPGRRGNARSFLPASRATTRRCSICCVSRARSAGRASRRDRSRSRNPRSSPLPLRSRCFNAITARPGRPCGASRTIPSADSPTTARRVLDVLRSRGASFFNDVRIASGLDAEDTRRGLGALVASGLVASDGFLGTAGASRARVRPPDRARSPGELRRTLEHDPHAPSARQRIARRSRPKRGHCSAATASSSTAC